MEKTVRKAFAILEYLAAQPVAHRVTDIAQGIGLTKPNVHRLLGTLVELGYVQRDEATSRYRATFKVWELARGLVAENDLQAAAHPVLHALSDEAGESAALGAFDRGDMVFVAQVERPTAIRAVARLGSRIPATVSSMGKAQLAWLPPEALDQAMLNLRGFTPHTLTEREAIERDLREARLRGYATSRGEYVEGVCGIAAPIFNASGAVVAAIGLWGSEEAILGSRMQACASRVMEAGAQISRRLGYVGAFGAAEALSPSVPSAAALPRAKQSRAVPRARRDVGESTKSR